MKKFLFLLFFSMCTVNANAAPITYIHTGSGSGTLDGVAFGASAPLNFTITAIGDTNNVASCSIGCIYNDNISASIHIETLGSFDFTTATRFFMNNNSGTVGFSRAGSNGADLFNGPTLVSWDMTSSIGPVSGTASLLQWGNSNIDTTGGVLFFNNQSNIASTFSATVAAVPEPSSYALLLAGIGLVGFAASRKKHAR